MVVARILLLLAVVIWGWTFVATKVCLQHMQPIELLGLRFSIAIPVMLLLIRVRRTSLRLNGKGRVLLLGSAIFATHFAVQVIGLDHTTATNTGWIIAITPLVLAAMARIFLGERLSRGAVIGIGVATLGVLLLVSRGDVRDLGWIRSVGDWLILASAHTWAFYTIAIRDVARSHDPLAVTFWVAFPVAAVLAAPVAVGSDLGRLAALPGEALAALLFLGVFGTALAHWFWQIGVARVGAAEAGIFLYLEPLATMALAVPYLKESFGVRTIVGGSMVLAGVAWAQRRSR